MFSYCKTRIRNRNCVTGAFLITMNVTRLRLNCRNKFYEEWAVTSPNLLRPPSLTYSAHFIGDRPYMRGSYCLRIIRSRLRLPDTVTLRGHAQRRYCESFKLNIAQPFNDRVSKLGQASTLPQTHYYCPFYDPLGRLQSFDFLLPRGGDGRHLLTVALQISAPK